MKKHFSDSTLSAISPTITFLALSFLNIDLSTNLAEARLCKKWGKAQEIGQFDVALLPEASGIAFSRLVKDRLYHHNDSGDGPFFYMTDLSGGNTERIEIANFSPLDIEDLATGPCDKKEVPQGTCLFLGDIGDNLEQRPFVEIIILKEEKTYNQPAQALNKIIASYPDRPHNAEALFVHPNGDLYVITKEFSRQDFLAKNAMIFRLSKKMLSSKKPVVFEKVGEIELPWINSEYDTFGQIVTGASISGNGKKIILLTYENAVEFNLDLSKVKNLNARELRKNHDYQIIPLYQLAPQQEAISFYPGSSDFIFSSESAGTEKADILKVQCLGSRRKEAG